MRPRLEHLKSTFPQIGYGALQNLLVANEGDVHKATLVCIISGLCPHMKTTSFPDITQSCL